MAGFNSTADLSLGRIKEVTAIQWVNSSSSQPSFKAPLAKSFANHYCPNIEPITVAAYVEQHPGSPATIKQHMSAIRMLFSWLTEKGILAMNPAREVKTEKFSRTEGKTPAFDTEQVQKLLDKIDASNKVGLRDRALLGTLAYTLRGSERS
jgi:site-specific recombinase XerC